MNPRRHDQVAAAIMLYREETPIMIVSREEEMRRHSTRPHNPHLSETCSSVSRLMSMMMTMTRRSRRRLWNRLYTPY